VRTIDANVILRYLTDDVPDQAKQAEELLKRVVDKRIDWSDAFTASQMLQREITEIYSFDKHFDRIDGITRIEL